MVRVSTTPTPGATQTHCPYCSLQCGITLRPTVPGLPGPLALEPQADFPTNRGGLCSKGWTATSLLDHPQRLLRPLVRTVRGDRTSAFREATWYEALYAQERGGRSLDERMKAAYEASDGWRAAGGPPVN